MKRRKLKRPKPVFRLTDERRKELREALAQIKDRGAMRALTFSPVLPAAPSPLGT